jgi:polar amino acid transport system substrate-binding protein
MNRRELLIKSALGGAVAAGALTFGTPVAQAQSADGSSTFDRVKQSKVLRIAVLVGEEPYFHKDLQTGQWSGACIEMAADIAKYFDAKVEHVESTWGNAVLDLQSGKVDLAFALNPTPARALVIDFTAPMLVHSFTVITKKGYPKPKTWEQLDKPSVKVSVDLGSSHELIARRYMPNATITAFKTRDEAVLSTATGRSDLLVVMAALAIPALKKNPQLGSLVIPAPLLTLPTNIGVRMENDKRWRDWLSAWTTFNRSMGQTREWMIHGYAISGVTVAEIPPEVQF